MNTKISEHGNNGSKQESTKNKRLGWLPLQCQATYNAQQVLLPACESGYPKAGLGHI
jgi:hypothetical protein